MENDGTQRIADFMGYPCGQFTEEGEGFGAPESFLNPFALGQVTEEPGEHGLLLLRMMPHTHCDASWESAPLLGLQPQFPVVYLLLLHGTRELCMEGWTVFLGYPE
jgi:hypothetical protein